MYLQRYLHTTNPSSTNSFFPLFFFQSLFSLQCTLNHSHEGMVHKFNQHNPIQSTLIRHNLRVLHVSTFMHTWVGKKSYFDISLVFLIRQIWHFRKFSKNPRGYRIFLVPGFNLTAELFSLTSCSATCASLWKESSSFK